MMRQPKTKEAVTGGNSISNLTVEMEQPPLDMIYGTQPMAGKVLYILKRDLSEVLRENKRAIWGELLRIYKNADEGIRGGTEIYDILREPDADPRKYPGALICTADKFLRGAPIISECYGKAMDVLRVESVRFFLLDSEGKARIDSLETGTYYICGLGETSNKSGVWNVRVDLKPGGRNRLRLDSGNMTGRRK